MSAVLTLTLRFPRALLLEEIQPNIASPVCLLSVSWGEWILNGLVGILGGEIEPAFLGFSLLPLFLFASFIQ